MGIKRDDGDSVVLMPDCTASHSRWPQRFCLTPWDPQVFIFPMLQHYSPSVALINAQVIQRRCFRCRVYMARGETGRLKLRRIMMCGYVWRYYPNIFMEEQRKTTSNLSVQPAGSGAGIWTQNLLNTKPECYPFRVHGVANRKFPCYLCQECKPDPSPQRVL
jgi:hypothetical protein